MMDEKTYLFARRTLHRIYRELGMAEKIDDQLDGSLDELLVRLEMELCVRRQNEANPRPSGKPK